MKKVISLIMSICMVVTMIPFTAYAANTTPEISLDEFSEQLSEMSEEYTDEPVSNRLIVKSERKIDKLDSVDVVEGYDDLHIVQFDNSESAQQALEHYNESKYIEYAEEDITFSVSESETSSSFTYDNHLSWGSSTIGVDDYFDYLGNIAELPEVTVGIIDTGIDLDHEFLKNRIIPTGVNYSDSGTSNSEEDDNGHGTHVAGIIADNTTDNVKIEAFKCLNSEGEGNLSNVCIALNAAVESNVDVINMSLGSRGTNSLLKDTINNAVEQGITVCVAAGNNGQNAKNYTPANIESCITVGAINENDQKPLWSNYGEAVDIWAPGSSIYSTYKNGTYETLSGTSMATPFVAAASSLLLSNNKNLKPNDVKALIKNNSRLLEDTFLDYELYALYIGVLCDYNNERTAQPTFSIDGGIYLDNITVEITCPDEDAEIYYSTNGKRASQDNGTLYTEPITIDKITTLNACAYKDGKVRSLQTSATYNVVTTDPDENFEIDENGIITKYTGSNVYLSIPETINGITVTGIGDSVFRISKIQIIVLPDTLTYIGANAFRSDSSLTAVYANNIQTIEKYAFYNCEELINIDLSMATYLGEYSFNDCYEIDALYNDKITEIKEGAFGGCDKLLYVELPNVNTIERNGFFGCIHIEMFVLPNVEKIGEGAFDDCLSITEFDLPNLKTIYGKNAFAGCSNLTSINIPLINGELPAYSFHNCFDIKEINLVNMTTIGEYALCDCSSLVSLDLPNTTSVDKGAFSSCSNLENIYIPSVTEIGYQAFRDTDNVKVLFAPSLVSTQSLPIVNSNTKIYLSSNFIEYNETSFREQNATIIAPKGSYAETVAANGIGKYDNNFKFVPSDYRDESIAAPANVTDLGRSICCSAAGIRFGFTWDNIDEIESLAADIEYGFIYSQKGAENLSIDTVDNKNIKKTVANNRVDHGDTTSFNLVISNIPKDYFGREITARAYVCIDGMYFYSNILKGSFSEVAQLVLADKEIDTNTKNAINNLLSKEV